jgi:hypothetical protein
MTLRGAINNTVGWMQFFLYRWGSVGGSTAAVLGKGEGVKSLKLKGSVDLRGLVEKSVDLKRYGPEREISWRVVGLRGGVGLGDCAGLRSAGVGGEEFAA